MIMQRTVVFVLLFIILFDVHGQSSPDNGQIVINNKNPLGGLMSTDGGAAAAVEVILNAAAPKPKNQIGGRRRKRQQPSKFFIHRSLLKTS